MTEVLLVRHAQSHANKRDFAAFGNVESPLTEKGIGQAEGLRPVFHKEYGIDPPEYARPVLSSEYTRPQQTARHAGFRAIHIDPIINESDVDRDIMSGVDVIAKHRADHWAPEESRGRAQRFLELIRAGELDYQIFFTHGMFIASVLLELDQPDKYPFDDADRGYVPLQATILKIEV